MLTVSEDGYIRLTWDELKGFRLIHLTSGLDEGGDDAMIYGAFRSAISGYTEWQSESTPAITIGWDWEMIFVDRRIQLRRISDPHSNLLMQDVARQNVSIEKSILLQGMFVDILGWQPVVLEQINTRYR